MVKRLSLSMLPGADIGVDEQSFQAIESVAGDHVGVGDAVHRSVGFRRFVGSSVSHRGAASFKTCSLSSARSDSLGTASTG